MAEKILKGIIFPGLEDTYIVPEVDDTLSVPGASADAKVVGEALSGKQPVGNYVKSINGATPDENGNIEIEVGSGGSSGSGVSVQSDWNVTDETDPAYIKNRPLVEAVGLVDIQPFIQYDNFVLDTNYNLYCVSDWVDYSLTIGKSYIVYWDGVEYECIGQNGDSLVSGSVLLGNLTEFGLSGNNEPFIIANIPNYGSQFFSLTDTEEGCSHTIRIAEEETVQKIDPKYLYAPDWTVTDETNPAYIKNKPFGEIPNTWVPLLTSREFGPFYTNASYGVQMYERPATFQLVIGENYRITWDNVVYECVAQDVNSILPGGIGLGNGTAFGLAGNNEPFVIYIVNGYEGYMSLTDTAAGATHTVGIEEIGTAIHKIDNKYLPDTSWNDLKDKPFGGDSIIIFKNRTLTFKKVPNGNSEMWESSITIEDSSSVDLIVNQTYTVVWDGVAYKRVCEIFQGVHVLGNTGILAGGVDSGEPFLIGRDLAAESHEVPCWIIASVELAEGWNDPSLNGTHTCEIKHGEIKYIDNKYLEIIDSNGGNYVIKEEYLPDNIGGGSSGPSLPTVTTEDAGKFLRVTDEGIWAAVSIPNAEGVGF